MLFGSKLIANHLMVEAKEFRSSLRASFSGFCCTYILFACFLDHCLIYWNRSSCNNVHAMYSRCVVSVMSVNFMLFSWQCTTTRTHRATDVFIQFHRLQRPLLIALMGVLLAQVIITVILSIIFINNECTSHRKISCYATFLFCSNYYLTFILSLF